MPYEAIIDEVDRLHQVGERLEGLAEYHPLVSQELLTIAGNVRSIATVVGVLLATKLHGGDGHELRRPTKPI